MMGIRIVVCVKCIKMHVLYTSLLGKKLESGQLQYCYDALAIQLLAV